MPALTLIQKDKKMQRMFDTQHNVLELLNTFETKTSSACAGQGFCGLCRIKILSGEVSVLTCVEKSSLSLQQLQQGTRLACQIKPVTDITVTIENPINVLTWKKLQRLDKTALSGSDDYGIAFDLGTTHLRLSLWNISQQRRVLAWSAFNPQFRFGADVLTRLMAAQESTTKAAELSRLIKQALKNALLVIAKLSVKMAQIKQLLVVGNTPMLALLSQKNFQQILQPEYWMQAIDCQIADIEEWQQFLGLNSETSIANLPPLAGFVGSDLLAGVFATELTQTNAPALLIDFGTNSELALWDGEKLWISSVPGGPAFEGSGISCGVPAGEGAIYRMTTQPEKADWDYQIIGKTAVTGLCGSALVDVIAQLVANGQLNRNGRFKNSTQNEYLLPLSSTYSLALKKQDVDIFQRAKAAIGAAQRQLCQESGVAVEQLSRMCVCGAFGQFLDVRNAQAIGLLPNIASEKIQLHENTALRGCELLLSAPQNMARLAQIRARVQIVNMAHALNFDEAFVDNLYLQPISFKN